MAKRTLGRPAVLEYQDMDGNNLATFKLVCRDLSTETLLRKLDKNDLALFKTVNKAKDIETLKDSLLEQLVSARSKVQLNKQIKALKIQENEVITKFEELGGVTSVVMLSEKMFDMVVIGGEKESAKEFIAEYDDFDNALNMIREDLAGN